METMISQNQQEVSSTLKLNTYLQLFCLREILQN